VKATEELCDTCGMVVDLSVDPLFKKHNSENYVNHVFLSHKHYDAVRIVQDHLDAVVAGEGNYDLGMRRLGKR
jgi:hypothetical protein